MSIELEASYGRGAPGGAEDLGRTPPQDLAAEQSVLGGMMLSKDAIADVVEQLRATDFYRPAHEMVYDAVLDLYGRGEPADAITVAATLTSRGQLGRVGGPGYLHTLISAVPTAANAGYYARIVRERAVLRRLVEAGTRIVQLGYAAEGGDVDGLVNTAQAEVYAVTERRASEDFVALGSVIEGTIDEIEASSHRGDGMVGVPTGFADLDQLTNGLHAGQMIVIAARPAIGKALALGTALPTPTGWTTMGEVAVGDEVLAADGSATRVVAATEVMHGRPCYEVILDDGTVVVADAQHGWATSTRAERLAGRAGRARTTEEIAADLAGADGPGRGPTADDPDHRIANTAPLVLPQVALPLAPYALGAWLGGGHGDAALLSTDDPEVLARVEGHGYRTEPVGATTHRWLGEHERGAVAALLRREGLMGRRRVPPAYLRAHEGARRELLAGLLDVAGGITADGGVEVDLADPALAQDVRELVVSLGHRCTPATDGGGEESVPTSGGPARQPRACVRFTVSEEVFLLERQRLLHKERRPHGDAVTSRRVVSVRPVPSTAVRCIEVAHPDHLYLATAAMVPTHNSTIGLDIARSASIRHGMTSVIFSLEMSKNEITMRLLSAEAKIPLQNMRKGTMREEDWTKLARTMGQVSEAPLFIDDSPNMTLMEIRAKCRRIKQQHDLKLVVIDYLQLMTSGKRVESRQQEVSEFSRALKLLAKELEVPVIAISQLNRGAEARTDKKPAMSDLRESGCLTAETRLMRADTGAEVTLGELVATNARDVPVWALNERLQLVPRTLTHAFSSGVKETYRLTLASGREIEATSNHPCLTVDGWKPLRSIDVGDRLGIVRHVPAPERVEAWDPDEIVLLAHMIGDGSMVRRQPIRYASTDEANLSAVGDAARRRFGITPIRDDCAAARVTTLRLPAPYRLTHGKRNPIAAWLDGLGLFGLRSHEKFVPDGVFGLPKSQAALFLRHLWATDGCVYWYEKHGFGRIYYASTSRLLADDVVRLLARFNILARVSTTTKGQYRECYQVMIYGAADQRRFLTEIGVHGSRGRTAEALLQHLEPVVARQPQMLDAAVRTELERVMAASAATASDRAASAGSLGAAVAVLDRADVDVVATNDVYWDKVRSVVPLGRREVYDATVLGLHNFVANGISMHNSIEQDADMVILLHREDAYDRESPRAGEADLIVAKHRNGPTDTIVVAFQGHYSRFVDMAQ